MEVQHNYLSQTAEELPALQEGSAAFYFANDHNQSFIIYRIKEGGLFESLVIQFSHQNITQGTQGPDAYRKMVYSLH